MMASGQAQSVHATPCGKVPSVKNIIVPTGEDPSWTMVFGIVNVVPSVPMRDVYAISATRKTVPNARPRVRAGLKTHSSTDDDVIRYVCRKHLPLNVMRSILDATGHASAAMAMVFADPLEIAYATVDGMILPPVNNVPLHVKSNAV